MRRRTTAAQVDDPDDVSAAEATALRILGGASQSANGLQRRLQQRGYSADAAQAAVERCRELGYVDDAKLAASVAARHRRSNHGRVRIVADLRARGVNADAIAAATEAIAGDEQDAAVAAAHQLAARRGGDSEVDQMTRRKIGAALQRRGFSGDVIVRALRSLD
ncbi:MAG: regulatory protein RecX [Candidatus Dormibacteraeota bacterium]|nr:regulatory protein RecX [Candidatus Dormibacteraeota bacterium]MBV9525870.1 regulatory protein RecX [Candidatus Dormibacteraeota bacterium]